MGCWLIDIDHTYFQLIFSLSPFEFLHRKSFPFSLFAQVTCSLNFNSSHVPLLCVGPKHHSCDPQTPDSFIDAFGAQTWQRGSKIPAGYEWRRPICDATWRGFWWSHWLVLFGLLQPSASADFRQILQVPMPPFQYHPKLVVSMLALKIEKHGAASNSRCCSTQANHHQTCWPYWSTATLHVPITVHPRLV